MLRGIVIVLMRLRHRAVTRPVRLLRIIAVVAVVVVRHIRVHIRLIVVQIDGFRLRVIIRPVAIVIRRSPRVIRRSAEDVPHWRTLDEDRSNHIVVTIQIRVSDDFHEEFVSLPFGNQRSHVLEDRWREASLNKESVTVTLTYLYHAQIVHPSVAVEVEVINHVTAGVENALELLHAVGLRESRCHRLEIQIERPVVVERGDGDGCDGRHFRRRRNHLSGVHGFDRSHRLHCRCYSPDAGPTTCQTQRCKS